MDSSYENVIYEQRGPVTLITIDRPERMNAIDGRTHHELVDAWDRFRADDDAYVAVLTGAGDRAFCAGGDLKAAFDGEGAPIDPRPEELAAHARGERPGVLGPSRWTDVYKPTIAAVNGVAYAGGLEWACWTDLCIADEHATFGVTCRRWNIGLADGGTQRLPRIVGFRRAMDLIVTGRVIDAAEAERIAALPQPAIRTDKEAAVRGFGRPLDEGLRIEAECFERSIFSAETLEGVRRFTERDHPDRERGGIPGRD